MGSLRYEIQRCVLHSLLFGVRFLRFGVVFYADLGIIILAEPGGSAVKYLTMSGNLPSFLGRQISFRKTVAKQMMYSRIRIEQNDTERMVQ